MMKTGIHPEYTTTLVRCMCGNEFETRSTAGDTITVDLCSECHPFYTGKQRIVDTGGRVQRFQNRRQARQNRQ
jgi:large subunit ribosomal protein L31